MGRVSAAEMAGPSPSGFFGKSGFLTKTMSRLWAVSSSASPTSTCRASTISRMEAGTGGRQHPPSKRRILLHMLKSKGWEAVLGALSTVSFAILIVEADYADTGPPTWVRAASFGFSAFYAVEVGVRMAAWRGKFFESKLNILDLGMVLVDLVSVVLDILATGFVISGGMLRGLRALRLTRTLSVSGRAPQLHLMSRGLLNAIMAAFFGAGLMLAVLAIFSAIAVQVIHPINLRVAETGVYHNCPRCPHAFESVRSSLLTFVQQYVVGDGWGVLMLPIIEEEPVTSLFFGVAFVAVHFTIMNVIMAVIVDIALKASQEDLAEKLQAKEREFNLAAAELREICRKMDKDGSGDLTEEELVRGYEVNAAFRNQLKAMDVKKDDMHIVFSIMDSDLSGTVNYQEFINQLYMMKKYDSHTMLLFIKHYVTETRQSVLCMKKDMDSKLGDLEQAVKEGPALRTLEDLDASINEGTKPLKKLSSEFATLREHITQEVQQSIKETRELEDLDLSISEGAARLKKLSSEFATLQLITQEVQQSMREIFPSSRGESLSPRSARPMSARKRGGEQALWPPAGLKLAAAEPKRPASAAPPSSFARSSWTRCCEAPAKYR